MKTILIGMMMCAMSLCGYCKDEICYVELNLVYNKIRKSYGVSVTIVSEHDNLALNPKAFFDGGYSFEVRELNGKLTANNAGGGDPTLGSKKMTIPAHVPITFLLPLPNNDILIKRIKGVYDLRLSMYESKPLIIEILDDGHIKVIDQNEKRGIRSEEPPVKPEASNM